VGRVLSVHIHVDESVMHHAQFKVFAKRVVSFFFSFFPKKKKKKSNDFFSFHVAGLRASEQT